MCILVIKTGVEKHANRVYTSDFFLPPTIRGGETIKLTDHLTYTPHEQIICGLNGVFGQWEVGHIILEPGVKFYAVFTRKIMAYDPVREARATHRRLQVKFEVTCKKQRRHTLNYWGYNDGQEISVLLSGGYDMVHEEKESYKVGTPLSKLPF